MCGCVYHTCDRSDTVFSTQKTGEKRQKNSFSKEQYNIFRVRYSGVICTWHLAASRSIFKANCSIFKTGTVFSRQITVFSRQEQKGYVYLASRGIAQYLIVDSSFSTGG